MENKFGFLSSSVDGNKLASTVQAGILMFSSTIILFGSRHGVVITTEQVSEVAGQIGIAIASLWFLFGISRKVIVKFFRKKTVDLI